MIKGLFPNGKKLLLAGSINLTSGPLKVGILKSTYTLNNAHQFWSEVSAKEITPVGGYAAGGVSMANPAFSVDADEVAVADYDDVVIADFTAPDFQYFILYKATGNPATSPLIGFIDLEAPISYAAKTIKIAWSSLGVLRMM